MNYRTFPKNKVSVGTIYRKQLQNDDGTIVVKESTTPFENPFNGLDSASFSASSQIRAGVLLKPAPSLSPLGSSIGSVDKVNSAVVENMMSNTKTD